MTKLQLCIFNGSVERDGASVFVVWRDLCQALLRNDFWLAMEKRRSLHRVTIRSLINYIANFYNGIFVEGLIQGNVTPEVGDIFF